MPSQSTEKTPSLPQQSDLYIVEWMLADPLALNSEAEALARQASRDREADRLPLASRGLASSVLG